MHGWPGWGELAAIAVALGLIALLTFVAFENTKVTAYFLGGLVASFIVLMGLARLIIAGAKRMPRSASAIWRYAIGNIHRRVRRRPPSSWRWAGLDAVRDAGADRTARSPPNSAPHPREAPAFFFLDVRNDELAAFRDAVSKEPGRHPCQQLADDARPRGGGCKAFPADKVNASPESNWALAARRPRPDLCR